LPARPSGCHEGPDGNDPIINTFIGRIHLQGTPGHPRTRSVALTVTGVW
jgi:hypothetical protein